MLDEPAMPIIAEGDEEPNDTFREQFLASAEAIVKVRQNRSTPEEVSPAAPTLACQFEFRYDTCISSLTDRHYPLVTLLLSCRRPGVHTRECA